MRVEATSVADYFEKVDPARRQALESVAAVVRARLPAGFEEGLMYGAVAWFVPPERYGKSYNGQPLTAVALAAQKQHLGLYLHCGYMADELASVARGFAAAGKRLDMGKSCVRFQKAEDLALEVIGEYLSEVSVERFVADYERGQAGRKQKAIVWQRPAGARPLLTGATSAKAAAAGTSAKAAGRGVTKTAAATSAKGRLGKRRGAANAAGTSAKGETAAGKTAAAKTAAAKKAKAKGEPGKGRGATKAAAKAPGKGAKGAKPVRKRLR